jgi:16S rRNA (cytidine1402-2'-O)-methyltransferase
VKLASENEIEVIPIPGASAAIAALSVSGLPTSSFCFLGFLPKQNKKLTESLRTIKDRPETLIFYESPKRVIKTLEAMSEVFGKRKISVNREITKVYEETLRGELSEVISDLKSRESIKGEIVLVVQGNTEDKEIFDSETIDKVLKHLKKEGHTLKDAVKQITSDSGMSKSTVYKKALEIWK